MLSGFSLKLIAIVTMVIDHTGAIFFPNIAMFRIIGRLSMPIFAFLCAEGYAHTSNKKKYLLRLLVFAFISEIPYDLMRFDSVCNFVSQNILFSFFLGVLALYLIDISDQRFAFIYPALLGAFAFVIASDYYMLAVLAVISFYYSRNGNSFSKLGIIISCVISCGFFLFGSQSYAIFATVPILLYNGKRGFKDKYYLFYWVYPAQFIVIYIVSKLL